jgi:hypothetical protein
VRVAGSESSCAYLAGWIASRLGWRVEEGRAYGPDGTAREVHLAQDPSGGVTRVELASGSSRFVAELVAPGSDLVRTWCVTDGSCPLPRVLKAGVGTDAELVASRLDASAQDPIYEEGLAAAAALARGRA